MGDDIKRIDITEFRELGFLQEVNRKFLHPLGLALEVEGGWDKDIVKKILDDVGIQFGDDALDNCMTLIKVLGWDKEHLGGIWDYRDDPEGIVFAPDLLDWDKRARVAEEWAKHTDARMKLFGGRIQPVPRKTSDAV